MAPPMGASAATPAYTNSSCKSCCTPAIIEELKKMANEYMEDKGCYYEPSSYVRSLAQQALNLCPVPPREEPDPDPTPPGRLEGEDSDRESVEDFSPLEGEESDDEEFVDPPLDGQDDNPDSPQPDSETPDADPFSEDTDDNLSYYSTPIRKPNHQRLMNARVAAAYGSDSVTLRTSKSYKFPVGLVVFMIAGDGSPVYSTVVESRLGQVSLQIEDAERKLFQKGDKVQFGIVKAKISAAR